MSARPAHVHDLENELLYCEIVPDPSHVRVRPVGALDLATVAVLDDELAGLRDAGFRALVVDLSRLVFMDSSGLRLLLRWTEAAEKDGFSIAVVPGPANVQRVFELTSTEQLIPFLQE
jgi:anti-sigma B factor antagonist